ncbi:hypothetical protein EUGRSUZ_K02597 [Eucalyptus grandis]|uniref:Uncharacterized protein n=2 Tax=Eucalyptus grandis TaxID=71139 RepID=A0ACC3IXU8_EUCGR|nr:hypothetical protein EUGRSUZ_K02597 [Eucalyptus grandis]
MVTENFVSREGPGQPANGWRSFPCPIDGGSTDFTTLEQSIEMLLLRFRISSFSSSSSSSLTNVLLLHHPR